MAAMLESFETEARRWCHDHGLDPDGSAPSIMIGQLGFALEKNWIRRARQISLAADDPPGRRGDRRPPSSRRYSHPRS